MKLASAGGVFATRVAALTFALSLSGARADADYRTPPVLTYFQRIVEITDDVTTSITNYLQISGSGVERTANVVTLSGAKHVIALPQDTAGQCYQLATQLLPEALRLAPGTQARGGDLNVVAGTAVAAVPVNFVVEMVAPHIERIHVSGVPAQRCSLPVHLMSLAQLRGIRLWLRHLASRQLNRARSCALRNVSST